MGEIYNLCVYIYIVDSQAKTSHIRFCLVP